MSYITNSPYISYDGWSNNPSTDDHNSNRERIELHRDILTTGVEGGISYWAQIHTYQPEPFSLDFEIEGVTFPELVISPVADAFDAQDLLCRVKTRHLVDSATKKDTVLVSVTEQDIALGCELFVAQGYNDYHKRFAAAYRAGDWDTAGSSIDAIDADIIMQLGLFGRVRLS